MILECHHLLRIVRLISKHVDKVTEHPVSPHTAVSDKSGVLMA
jgi:hypothetical protein